MRESSYGSRSGKSGSRHPLEIEKETLRIVLQWGINLQISNCNFTKAGFRAAVLCYRWALATYTILVYTLSKALGASKRSNQGGNRLVTCSLRAQVLPSLS